MDSARSLDDGSFSESNIQAQMRRGHDMSVPVDMREATSPAVRGIAVCRDSQVPLEHSKAKVVEDGQDSTGLRLPEGVKPIDRSAPIEVVRGEDAGSPVELIQDVGGQGKTAAATAAPVYASRPPPSDVVGVCPDAEVRHQDSPAHGIGVQPVAREESRLVGLSPVRQQGDDLRKEAQVTPTAPEEPQVQLSPAQPTLGVITAPQVAPVANPQLFKQPVTIASDTMGKHRIRVLMASVSESVVILGYHNTDDEAIIEPPITPSDSSPLQVTIGQETYPCRSYGFTSETEIMGIPLLLVVLVRDNG